jgi:hypothetical protein
LPSFISAKNCATTTAKKEGKDENVHSDIVPTDVLERRRRSKSRSIEMEVPQSFRLGWLLRARRTDFWQPGLPANSASLAEPG